MTQPPVHMTSRAWISNSPNPGEDGVEEITFHLHYDPRSPLEVTAAAHPVPAEVREPQPWVFSRDLLRSGVMDQAGMTVKHPTAEGSAVGDGDVVVGVIKSRVSPAGLVCFRFPTGDGPRYVGVMPDKVLAFICAMYLLLPSEDEDAALDIDGWLDELRESES